jgi:HEAT repeat protein
MLFWKMRVNAKLKSENPQHRKEAVGMLAGAKRRSDSIAPLVKALGDRDTGVRKAVVAALVELGLRFPVVAALKSLPANADADLRQAAGEVLAEIKGRCLAKVVASGRFRKFDFAFKDAATRLAEMGDACAVLPLVSVLEAGDLFDRVDSARALGKLGEKAKAAVPALTQALLDDNLPVVQAAAVALDYIAGRDEAAVRMVVAPEIRKSRGQKPVV